LPLFKQPQGAFCLSPADIDFFFLLSFCWRLASRRSFFFVWQKRFGTAGPSPCLHLQNRGRPVLASAAGPSFLHYGTVSAHIPDREVL